MFVFFSAFTLVNWVGVFYIGVVRIYHVFVLYGLLVLFKIFFVSCIIITFLATVFQGIFGDFFVWIH
jgi:hypothetical protein